MVGSVVGTHLIGHVVHRCGQQFEVVDEHRGGEHKVEIDRSALERVVGVCGKHVHRCLLCRLNVSPFGLHVTVESVVDERASGSVVAMGCDDVLALLEQCLVRGGEMERLALKPRLARRDDLRAVDVKLENVVVRINYVKVVGYVVRRKVHRAPRIHVGILNIPVCVYVGIFVGRAYRALLRAP